MTPAFEKYELKLVNCIRNPSQASNYLVRAGIHGGQNGNCPSPLLPWRSVSIQCRSCLAGLTVGSRQTRWASLILAEISSVSALESHLDPGWLALLEACSLACKERTYIISLKILENFDQPAQLCDARGLSEMCRAKKERKKKCCHFLSSMHPEARLVWMCPSDMKSD